MTVWAIWDSEDGFYVLNGVGNWVSWGGKVITTKNKLIAHSISKIASGWEVREYIEQTPGTETIDILETPFRKVLKIVE